MPLFPPPRTLTGRGYHPEAITPERKKWHLPNARSITEPQNSSKRQGTAKLAHLRSSSTFHAAKNENTFRPKANVNIDRMLSREIGFLLSLRSRHLSLSHAHVAFPISRYRAALFASWDRDDDDFSRLAETCRRHTAVGETWQGDGRARRQFLSGILGIFFGHGGNAGRRAGNHRVLFSSSVDPDDFEFHRGHDLPLQDKSSIHRMGEARGVADSVLQPHFHRRREIQR